MADGEKQTIKTEMPAKPTGFCDRIVYFFMVFLRYASTEMPAKPTGFCDKSKVFHFVSPVVCGTEMPAKPTGFCDGKASIVAVFSDNADRNACQADRLL